MAWYRTAVPYCSQEQWGQRELPQASPMKAGLSGVDLPRLGLLIIEFLLHALA